MSFQYFNTEVFKTFDIEKLYPFILVAGPGGCGKTTTMKEVFNRNLVQKMISFTTRKSREHEVHGKDYYFITKEQFEQLLADGKILEATTYLDNYYGILVSEFVEKLSQYPCYNVVDHEGIVKFKAYKKLVSIFMYTTLNDAEKQMRERGDTEKHVQQRMDEYKLEIKNKGEYDYVIPNHNGFFDQTVQLLEDIVTTETLYLSPKLVTQI